MGCNVARNRRWTVCGTLLAVALLGLPGADAFATWIVPPAQEAAILRLAEPWQMDAEVVPGVTWRAVAIRQDALVFGLVEAGAPPIEVAVTWEPGQRQQPHVAVAVQAPKGGSQRLRDAAETLRARLQLRAPTVLPRDVLRWVEPEVRPMGTPSQLTFQRFSLTECVDAARPPPVWLTGAAVACALCAAWALRRRMRPSAVALVAVTLVGLPAWLWQYLAPATTGGIPEQIHEYTRREFLALSVLLAVVGLGWLGLIVRGLRALRGVRASRAHVRVALASVGVGLVSAAIRYGLTDLNLLSDGAAGYGRLLVYFSGYGADHVLLYYLLPDRVSGDMTAHMAGIRALSTLAPPLLVVAAYRLGMGTLGAGLAGLTLAVWPLHAAISASDVLQGPVLTLVALGVVQLRSTADAQQFLGFLTLGFAVWARPELALTLLPFAAVAWIAPRRRRDHWPVLAGTLALLAILVIRWNSMQLMGLFSRSTLGIGAMLSHLSHSPWADSALLPWFVALGGLAAPLAWRRQRGVLGVAVLGACVALGLAAARSNPASPLEFCRFAMPAVPWLSVLAALGWTALANRLPPATRAPAVALLAVGLLALPIALHGYLGRHYDSTAEEPLLRQAVSGLPAGTTLVVPGEARDDGLDPCLRYATVLAHLAATGQAKPLQVVCAQALLDGKLPSGPGPSYWFHGTDCMLAVSGKPLDRLGNCAAIEAKFARQRVWQAPLELWNRRSVTSHADPGPPNHQPAALLFLDVLQPQRSDAAAR